MRLAAILVLAVTTAACGRIHQRSETWLAEKSPEGERLWLGLTPTRTDEDGGMFGDREIRDAAPYTASVTARGEHVDTPLRVHALRLHVGGEIVQLHDAAAPLEAPLERGSEGQSASARIGVALGDRLVWKDGEVVALEIEATLPWDTTPKTVKRELRAVLNESSGTKLDAVLGQ